jgi:hypothetical protein
MPIVTVATGIVRVALGMRARVSRDLRRRAVEARDSRRRIHLDKGVGLALGACLEACLCTRAVNVMGLQMLGLAPQRGLLNELGLVFSVSGIRQINVPPRAMIAGDTRMGIQTE